MSVADMCEHKIQVGNLWYPVTSLGFGKRVGIWLQGCSRGCPGCISPEFQAPKGGRSLSVEALLHSMNGLHELDGLTISGGEPFEQLNGLYALVSGFYRRYSSDIIIFTGYTLEALQSHPDPKVEKILDMIAVLVDGPYREEMNSGRGFRGSDNQRIHLFRHQDRYENLEEKERKLQCVMLKDRLWMIGIPPGNL